MDREYTALCEKIQLIENYDVSRYNLKAARKTLAKLAQSYREDLSYRHTDSFRFFDQDEAIKDIDQQIQRVKAMELDLEDSKAKLYNSVSP